MPQEAEAWAYKHLTLQHLLEKPLSFTSQVTAGRDQDTLSEQLSLTERCLCYIYCQVVVPMGGGL